MTSKPSQHPSDPTQTVSTDGSAAGAARGEAQRSAPELGASLCPGEQLGPYVIREEIGRGGMGVVYRGHDPTLERDVAIKVIPPGVANDATKRARFLREARSAAQLEHPAIVPVYMAGEQGALVYLAMGYVEGETLASRIKRPEGISLGEALGILRAVAGALQHAHAKGLVHRDIKPENIMIDTSGHVKVMDFGLARSMIAPAEGQITDTGLYLGTPIYSSPEQVKAKPLDGRSDLYSLGVVLYEMVTRRRPFQGASAYETFHAIVHGEVTPAQDVDPHVPAAVSTFIAWLMARDPQQRPASAQEVLARCTDLLEHLGESTKGLVLEPLPTTRTFAAAGSDSHAPTLSPDRARQPNTAHTPSGGDVRLASADDDATASEREDDKRMRGAPPSLVATLLLGLLALGLVVFGSPPSSNGQPNGLPSQPPQKGSSNVAGGTNSDATLGDGDGGDLETGVSLRQVMVLFEPFETTQTIESLDWLKIGIPRMLKSALADSEALHLVSQRRLEGELERVGAQAEDRHTRLQAIAEALEIDVIVRGQYYLFGERLRLDVVLIDPDSGAPRDQVSHTGREEEIFALLDRTAEQLRETLLASFLSDPLATVSRQRIDESAEESGTATARQDVEQELKRREAPLNAERLRTLIERLRAQRPEARAVASEGDEAGSVGASEEELEAEVAQATRLAHYLKRLMPGMQTDDSTFQLAQLLLELRTERLSSPEVQDWLETPLGYENFYEEHGHANWAAPKGQGKVGEVLSAIQRSLEAARRAEQGGAAPESPDEAERELGEAPGEAEREQELEADRRRAFAARHAMISSHHLAAAHRHRDLNEPARMADSLQLALLHISRSLIAEPEFRPANELLREIKQTEWYIDEPTTSTEDRESQSE